jgi:hypothetical protein
MLALMCLSIKKNRAIYISGIICNQEYNRVPTTNLKMSLQIPSSQGRNYVATVVAKLSGI